MQEPTPSEVLRRALRSAIADDDWASSNLDTSVSEYVRDAQLHDIALADIRRSLRIHVQQVGLGLSAEHYETIARHVIALAESAHRGEFRGRHISQTLSLPESDSEG